MGLIEGMSGPFGPKFEPDAHRARPSEDVNVIRHALRVSAEADERDALIARRNGEGGSAEFLQDRAVKTRQLYEKMGGS